MVLVLFLLVAGCGGGGDDGEGDVPETSVAVPVNDLYFDNQSETSVSLALLPIAEGFTAEEVLARLGERGTRSSDRPPATWWADFQVSPPVVMQLNASSDAETAQRIDPGAYIIVCAPGEETTLAQTGDYFTGGSLLAE